MVTDPNNLEYKPPDKLIELVTAQLRIWEGVRSVSLVKGIDGRPIAIWWLDKLGSVRKEELTEDDIRRFYAELSNILGRNPWVSYNDAVTYTLHLQLKHMGV